MIPARRLVAALIVSSQVATAQIARRQARVDIAVPKQPQVAKVDGHRVLVYELHITNFGRGPLELKEIDVSGPTGHPLATVRDSATVNSLGVYVAYLWVPLDSSPVAPARLSHRLVFDILDTADQRRDGGTQQAIDSVMVPVIRAASPVIRAPLDSGEWLAADSPSNTSGHRRSLTAIEGHASLSQRFAIDWQLIGPNGDTHHDDDHKNENYWGFGKPVRSVAIGEVVAILDSLPDNTPHDPLPPITPRTLAGNFVTIRIGPDQYATYAHLQRGSVRVHVHQHLMRGEVIGLLGNSGQATGPHLHFQITDAPSVLASEGIPYILERYTFLGYAQDFEPNKHPSIPRRAEMPGNEAVVGLP